MKRAQVLNTACIKLVGKDMSPWKHNWKIVWAGIITIISKDRLKEITICDLGARDKRIPSGLKNPPGSFNHIHEYMSKLGVRQTYIQRYF